MRKDIALMMDCDCVLLIDNWEYSRGAALEVQIATRLDIPVFTSLEELSPA